jgi:hypothetical protein
MASREYNITRINPMSAFRTAFALSVVGLCAWVLCCILLYLGMDIVGVWDQINDVIGGVGGEGKIGFGTVLLFSLLIGIIFGIIFSITVPLIAIVYNAVYDLFGGLKVTLKEES